jgi:hypothetical protein
MLVVRIYRLLASIATLIYFWQSVLINEFRYINLTNFTTLLKGESIEYIIYIIYTIYSKKKDGF